MKNKIGMRNENTGNAIWLTEDELDRAFSKYHDNNKTIPLWDCLVEMTREENARKRDRL